LHEIAKARSNYLEVLSFTRSPFMAPSTIESIGKKKRRRGKKEEGASSSPAALGVHTPKQRKRRAQRDGLQAPGAHPSLSFI
jgi:hypothetical protein